MVFRPMEVMVVVMVLRPMEVMDFIILVYVSHYQCEIMKTCFRYRTGS